MKKYTFYNLEFQKIILKVKYIFMYNENPHSKRITTPLKIPTEPSENFPT